MTHLPETLKRLLAEADHPLGIKELLRLSGLNPGAQTDLKRTLREMVRSGELLKEGKRYVVAVPREARARDGTAAAFAGRLGSASPGGGATATT